MPRRVYEHSAAFESAVRSTLSPFFDALAIPTVFPPTQELTVLRAYFPGKAVGFDVSRGFLEPFPTLCVRELPAADALPVLERYDAWTALISARPVEQAFGSPATPWKALHLPAAPTESEWVASLAHLRDELEAMRPLALAALEKGELPALEKPNAVHARALCKQLEHPVRPLRVHAWQLLSYHFPEIIARVSFDTSKSTEAERVRVAREVLASIERARHSGGC